MDGWMDKIIKSNPIQFCKNTIAAVTYHPFLTIESIELFPKCVSIKLEQKDTFVTSQDKSVFLWSTVNWALFFVAL